MAMAYNDDQPRNIANTCERYPRTNVAIATPVSPICWMTPVADNSQECR